MSKGDLDSAAWFTSSYSIGNGSCVEVADLGGAVAMRDSKWQAGPVLSSTAEGWRAFVTGMVGDEFGAP
jgi:uncharacterized protein DUF397